MDKIKIFTDGGARGNPGPAAAGVVFENLAGKERVICGKYLGVATNNVAEYQAVLLALETLKDKISQKETELEFFMDSLLVVRQLTGDFKIKNPNLASIAAKIGLITKSFAKVTYSHIPREENQLADAEVNRVLDSL